MANEFQPRSQGAILPDAVTVFIDNKIFHGFQTVKVSKSIDSIANSFSMSVDDRFQETDEAWVLKPGAEIKINIGDERVITGFIETLSTSYGEGSRSYNIAGRSKSADLIDCSAKDQTEFTNVTIAQLAEQLVAPFGLKVFLSVDPGEAFAKYSVKQGESVFEAINRAARTLGFFWVSTREGNIRLTRAGRARATSELHQDVNMKSGSLQMDNSKRFSEYIVKGQIGASDNFNGALASGGKGTATDAGITRFRPLVMIAENSVDTAKAIIRAQWEASTAVAKAFELNTTVEGWRQADGILWGINQIVKVRSRLLGIDRDMLITGVDHSQDVSGGTITGITLTRPDAYTPDPIKKEEDDPGLLLGPTFNS